MSLEDLKSRTLRMQASELAAQIMLACVHDAGPNHWAMSMALLEETAALVMTSAKVSISDERMVDMFGDHILRRVAELRLEGASVAGHA